MERRQPARRSTRRPSGLKPASPFPTLEGFIRDCGGEVSIGKLGPVECAAVASDEDTMYVALKGRRGETLMQLLARLDQALGPAIDDQLFVDEINA